MGRWLLVRVWHNHRWGRTLLLRLFRRPGRLGGLPRGRLLPLRRGGRSLRWNGRRTRGHRRITHRRRRWRWLTGDSSPVWRRLLGLFHLSPKLLLPLLLPLLSQSRNQRADRPDGDEDYGADDLSKAIVTRGEDVGQVEHQNLHLEVEAPARLRPDGRGFERDDREGASPSTVLLTPSGRRAWQSPRALPCQRRRFSGGNSP